MLKLYSGTKTDYLGFFNPCVEENAELALYRMITNNYSLDMSAILVMESYMRSRLMILNPYSCPPPRQPRLGLLIM